MVVVKDFGVLRKSFFNCFHKSVEKWVYSMCWSLGSSLWWFWTNREPN